MILIVRRDFMSQVEDLVRELKSLPPVLITEIADYVGYIKMRHNITDKKLAVQEITLASETSLAKDWLLPEEDTAWHDL